MVRTAGKRVSSSEAGAIRTSIGISRNAGPGTPDTAVRTAISTYSGMRCVWKQASAHLLIGRTMPTWSISWSEPRRRFENGPWPPITRIGELARQALAMPVTPSVTPGPAVSTAQPIRPGLRRL